MVSLDQSRRRLSHCLAVAKPKVTCNIAGIAGERLLSSPPDDPHAYALYFYTRAGDHIGWHYDTSYYVGRRYTVLLGVIDRSSCRLDYELHTRERGASVARERLPGSLSR